MSKTTLGNNLNSQVTQETQATFLTPKLSGFQIIKDKILQIQHEFR